MCNALWQGRSKQSLSDSYDNYNYPKTFFFTGEEAVASDKQKIFHPISQWQMTSYVVLMQVHEASQLGLTCKLFWYFYLQYVNYSATLILTCIMKSSVFREMLYCAAKEF